MPPPAGLPKASVSRTTETPNRALASIPKVAVLAAENVAEVPYSRETPVSKVALVPSSVTP